MTPAPAELVELPTPQGKWDADGCFYTYTPRQMEDYAAACIAASLAAHGRVEVSPVWTARKPQRPGVYGIRGFQLGADREDQFEAVILVREYEGELIHNLHRDTGDDEFDDWSHVADLSEKFEWCRFDFATAALGEKTP